MAIRRNLFLSNPQFQLKFCFFVSSLVFLTGLVYPAVIYSLIQNFVISFKQFNLEAVNDFNKNQTNLIAALLIIHLIFTSIIFVICIFHSHKIAGPLYKLKKVLEEIKEGSPASEVKFRKNDNFHDLAVAFNEAMAKLQEGHIKDISYLNEIGSYINNLALVVPEDKKSVLTEINNKIQEIQDRFKNQS